MADGLYLEDGSFLPFKGEDLTTELATRENAGAWLSGVGLWLDQLPDPDPVLRKRGDDAAILAELSADDQVTVAMLSRKNRVLNCPHYGFRAGAPDGEQATPEADELYRRFAKDLERANLRTVISGMLDAPFYGYTPLELMWRPGPDGWWHLVDVVPRPYHWFAFDAENKPIFRGEWGAALYDERLRTLPPGKFVFVSHHASYDNPYGLRLLSRCLWPVAFKRGGMQFYARFAEKYGQPWLVLKAPSKASKLEKRDMAGDLKRMVRDCLAVIPYGSEMEFLTAGSIPAAKMKMKRPHNVPLSRQALDVLRELQTITGKNRWLFPSRWNKSRHETGQVLNLALRRMGYGPDVMTGHGFRAMAATTLSEQGWPSETIERQLAHVDKNQVRAAYQRSDLLTERRNMVQAWADWLDMRQAWAILGR